MTIQLAHMRVLAFIRGSSPAALEIDYMEYASDLAAQGAYVTSATPASATGGTITTSGAYTIHSFTSNGTFTPASAFNVEYLVVGGGGGGASGSGSHGGGGGAGDFRTATGFAVTAQGYSITVGAGGGKGVTGDTFGKNGNDSVFSSITSIGGGGGGGHVNSGLAGGSGGGGGGGALQPAYVEDTYGGTSSAYGNDGGKGTLVSPYEAGGGGGASAVGEAAETDGAGHGGDGGNGTASSISGSSVTYAGGGGGAGGTLGAGGTGGGANAGTDQHGTANTGGGGGGSVAAANGGNGGSGIVIIRYLTPTLQSYSESTIKTEGSYALKLEATTDALNETVTKTLTGGDILDLTGKNTIKLDARSTGTGSNLEMTIANDVTLGSYETLGNLFIDGQSTINDETGTHTPAAQGDAVISGAQFCPYGKSSSSIALDGTGDYVSVPDHADWDLGTGDWTIDAWVYMAGSESFYPIASTTYSATDYTIWYATDTNRISIYYGNGAATLEVQSLGDLTDAWHHIAVEKYNGTLYLIVDGVVKGSVVDAQTWNGDNALLIGGETVLGRYFSGYIDNFRLSKGTSLFQGTGFNLNDAELGYAFSDSHTINISTADTYQTDSWDISGVSDSDKDNIDQIQFKVLNEDSARTYYIDNVYGQ